MLITEYVLYQPPEIPIIVVKGHTKPSQHGFLSVRRYVETQEPLDRGLGT